MNETEFRRGVSRRVRLRNGTARVRGRRSSKRTLALTGERAGNETRGGDRGRTPSERAVFLKNASP